MKKIALSLFLTAVIGSALAAPQMPKKCVAFRPKKLGAIILTEKEAAAFMKSGTFGQTDAPGKGQATYWDVYSDRADNTTYESPNSSTKFSSLDFNERVRIAQIQGNYALVYSEPKVGLQYPLISELAECKGWIPMNHLLLWQSCLANDRGIYNKALLCANLQPRCELFSDIPEQIDFFDALPDYDLSLYANKKQKTTPASALEALEALELLLSDEGTDYADRDGLFEACKALAERMEHKNGWLLYPLGIALSGKQRTPGGGVDLACMMGREKTVERLHLAIERLRAAQL